MKKKLLASNMLTGVMILSGCGNHQPAIPIDNNPSQALQFARAMDLMAITDAGDNYLIYNYLTDTYHIYPYETPRHAGQQDKVQSAHNGMADLAAGILTHTTLIPGLGLLTARRPATALDGAPRIGSWTTDVPEIEGKMIDEIIKSDLPTMAGFKDNSVCAQHWTNVSYMPKHIGTQGKPVDLEPKHLPCPPINTSGMLKPYGFNACVYYLASFPENQTHFLAMSVKLGAERALFIPGYDTHPPYIYHNGNVLTFSKNR